MKNEVLEALRSAQELFAYLKNNTDANDPELANIELAAHSEKHAENLAALLNDAQTRVDAALHGLEIRAAGVKEPTQPAPRAPAVQQVPTNHRRVSVDVGVLQMVRNALSRDAEEGRIVRGEMLEELEKSIAMLAAAPQAPAVPKDDLATRLSRKAEALRDAHPGESAALDVAGLLDEAVSALSAPQAPLTDEQMLKCLRSITKANELRLARDVGPYEVTEPTQDFRDLVQAVRAAGVKEPGNAGITGPSGSSA